ncbi:MAG TPA: DUF4143 domain-containing protein, partial [Candidatus Babeliales bacterium]|nr:DUF4143 domain-containing protein [Candidatus Babeliales bacterium]
IKTPKLFFYDTALVCALLGIKTAADLELHPFKGGIFETFVVSEIFKFTYNHNQVPGLYFWRDTRGHEIDLLVERSYGDVVPVEVKAGMTMMPDQLRNLQEWRLLVSRPAQLAYAVYGGDRYLEIKADRVYPWDQIAELLGAIYGTTDAA